MATTDDASLYEEMRMARNHGLRTRDSCEYWSFNCRLDAISGSVTPCDLTAFGRVDGATQKFGVAV